MSDFGRLSGNSALGEPPPGKEKELTNLEKTETDSLQKSSASMQQPTDTTADLGITTKKGESDPHSQSKPLLPSSDRTAKCKKCWRYLLIAAFAVFSVIMAISIIVFVVLPVVFYSSSWVRRQLIFFTYDSKESFNLSNPDSFDLFCPRNLYIKSEPPSISLGTWYIPSVKDTCDRKSPMFQGNETVFIFIHGIPGSRGTWPGIMKVLSTKVKVYVVALDYRNFGDSTAYGPTRQGLVNDTLAVYRKIRETVPKKRIFLWGHSFGASVAVYAAAELHKAQDSPGGIVLEATFDSVARVVEISPLTDYHRWLPYFNALIIQPIRDDPTVNFDNLEALKRVDDTVPVLILHAEDDGNLPISMGRNVYDHWKSRREKRPMSANITFIAFSAKYEYGHVDIYRSPRLPGIVTGFIDNGTNS